MSWQQGKRAEALAKGPDFYTQKDILDAWTAVFTGPYGDTIIYSLFAESDKPYIKLDNLSGEVALFREGKRDLVDQILRIANTTLTKEGQK